MSRSYKGTIGSCGKQNETTKKGVCLLELRHPGMVRWGFHRQLACSEEHGENSNYVPSTVGEEQNEDKEAVTTESLVLPEIRKRKCLTLDQHREGRAARHAKPTNSSFYKSKKIRKENSRPCKKENSIDRWSIDRYKHAEKCMMEVMKVNGAVLENPISRSALRVAARKHIGDTGLLDHLLKHIDGKVTPSGIERFRRCYNTEGVMQYWLERADLVKIKSEAGVPEPNWVPPSWWKPGSVNSYDSFCAGQLTPNTDEMAKMKRDMETLIPKNQEQDRSNSVEEMHKELVKWRGKIDKRLMEISSSLSGMQDKIRELVMWKSKAEQQLTEISNVLSSMQASKQCSTCNSTGERWEDWLERSNLDSIQGEEFAPWLENTYLINLGLELDPSLQEPCSAPQSWLKPCDSSPNVSGCARELELVKEDMAKMKRDVEELGPKRMEKEQAMLKELGKWRDKMEQQMVEISNTVSSLQASKQYNIGYL